MDSQGSLPNLISPNKPEALKVFLHRACFSIILRRVFGTNVVFDP